MSTTFIAISNMSGIACASDTDHTIYQLSRKFPFAVAVNSYSPIPWERIINEYKRLDLLEEKDLFLDYAKDFEQFLSSMLFTKDYANLTIEDSNIIFMGYGKEDLFPSIYDTCIMLNQDNKFVFDTEKTDLFEVSHTEYAHINLLGNLDSVSTLIWGATKQTNEFLIKKHLETFEIYKKRVLERFKGTKFEDFVTKKLDAYNAEDAFVAKMNETIDNTYHEVLTGIDSFSIEDMVVAAETIVNAEVRLDHLSSGCKTPLNTTREIAVINRVEGLTWIKHSLFAI